MNKILLGLFFIILGLLFANMLTNVCGCKDLVEGQSCRDARPDGCVNCDCIRNTNSASCHNTGHWDQNCPLCEENPSLTGCDNCCIWDFDAAALAEDGGDSSSGGDGGGDPTNTVPAPPINPTPGSYKLSCNNGEMMFTSL